VTDAVREPVPIVRTSCTAAVAKVTETGLNVQLALAGRVPHDKVRLPVNPPWGVIVRVVVPVEPRAIVRLLGVAVAVKPGATTETVRTLEVLPLKFESPA
jgi:hypothetical protein